MDLFAKCFCLPQMVTVVIALSCIAIALIVYWLLLIVARKLTQRNSLAQLFFLRLRLPVLLFFLEVASLVALGIVEISDSAAGGIRHALYVLFILTVGWFCAGITGAFYNNFVGKREVKSRIHRAQLTQVLFLYRFLMFCILVLTLALTLMTFPYIKNIGVGILGSAGVAGLALGIAARPILLNLMAGFQIASTKMLQIGDTVFIENECARIESINLTHIVVCTWDMRRRVIPVSYFIDKPFENWDLNSSELLAVTYIYCDYTVPVDAIRAKTEELLAQHVCWNGKMWSVVLSECTEQSVQIRIAASTNDYGSTADLRHYLREQLVGFLQKEYPHCLPRLRYDNENRV